MFLIPYFFLTKTFAPPMGKRVPERSPHGISRDRPGPYPDPVLGARPVGADPPFAISFPGQGRRSFSDAAKAYELSSIDL